MSVLRHHDPEIETLWRSLTKSEAGSIAVVSAEPGEGTTTLAAALARRAALSGRRTLLVDLNLHRPGVMAMLKLPPAPGASKTMAGGLHFREHDGFGVLAEIGLAETDRWREPARLQEQLLLWQQDWDFIVLDTAAILYRGHDTIPALAVAQAADATLMVAMAGRTTATRVREAREKLQACGARLIGAVLNDRDNPPLNVELEREMARLSRFLPGLANKIGGRLRRSRLVRVRI